MSGDKPPFVGREPVEEAQTGRDFHGRRDGRQGLFTMDIGMRLGHA
jgi:hypothetical protein